jgi:transcriptional regulator GlxA family with amidase domain
MLEWLRKRAKDARRVGSICTGAFLLASAGLLDGKRATTHWRFAGLLKKWYPKVIVDSEPIFVRDGKMFTSAGVSAGIDLALAMVEEDHGTKVALEVARDMVLYLRRSGGQSQFSTVLATQTTGRDTLRELQGWILEHLHEPLTVETMAAQAAMSPRHLSRLFLKEFGATPARFVENLRVESARRNLEESRDGIKEIADHCGFGSAESMRRAFQKVLHTPPSTYRDRFAAGQ